MKFVSEFRRSDLAAKLANNIKRHATKEACFMEFCGSHTMAIMKFGYQNRVIALAEATWSGLHETLLKPCSHVCEMHDNLWTINGEEIWVIHGQYLNPIWQGWQIDGQMGMIDRELNGSETCKDTSRRCLEFLIGYFKKMSEYKVKIDG